MSDPFPQDPAEAAFEALRGEVALLRRAVEALAAAPDPVDTGPAVARLTAVVGDVADQVGELAARPKMTQGEILAYMGRIAEDVAHEPKEAMWKAQAALVDVSGQLARAAGVLHGRRAEHRRLWLVGVGSALSAVLVWTALAGPIARLAPARWGWAEHMAAASLAMPLWQAGEQLLRHADESRWRSQAQALAWLDENRSRLADCARRAKARRRAVACEIEVAPGQGGL